MNYGFSQSLLHCNTRFDCSNVTNIAQLLCIVSVIGEMIHVSLLILSVVRVETVQDALTYAV